MYFYKSYFQIQTMQLSDIFESEALFGISLVLFLLYTVHLQIIKYVHSVLWQNCIPSEGKMQCDISKTCHSCHGGTSHFISSPSINQHEKWYQLI